MGIFHVLLIMMLEKRVKLQSLKFAVSIDQVYNIMQCLHCIVLKDLCSQ